MVDLNHQFSFCLYFPSLFDSGRTIIGSKFFISWVECRISKLSNFKRLFCSNKHYFIRYIENNSFLKKYYLLIIVLKRYIKVSFRVLFRFETRVPSEAIKMTVVEQKNGGIMAPLFFYVALCMIVYIIL